MVVDKGQCIQCGYCCTKVVCLYGKWNVAKGQCEFLTDDNLCSKYDEIVNDSGSTFNPAFGAGCSSTLFNSRRDKKLKELQNVR